MYRKVMFVMSFVVVLGLFSSASAGTFVWEGDETGGTWENNENWTGPGGPGCGDEATINRGPDTIWDAVISSASGLVKVEDLYIGSGEGEIGHLTVVSGGTLEVPCNEDHGYLFLAVGVGSKGSLTIRDGGTVITKEISLGKGGDAVLNMSGGYLHCTQYWFSLTGGEIHTGSGHINLDGGLIETGYLWMNSGDPQQDSGSISITKGVMVVHWDVSWLFKQEVERGLITGYNAEATNFDYDEALNNIAWKWDEVAGTTTMWAIPEPATVLLLGLGGLALIRKKR